MTEVLQSSPSHFPSFSSSASTPHVYTNSNVSTVENIIARESDQEEENREEGERKERDRQGEGDQLSLLTLLVAAFRKSLIGCSLSGNKELCSMEIGLPTNVRHVAHVTFDRFHGFLGLPVEFEPEVPKRAPSASASVFGVSTESMQLSLDSRGNSVPTILILLQSHLYARGGLQAEGIFRINAENNHEEYVREQLNRGVIPESIDVHCLAGLIKAWFRELPSGVLDSLPPEEVMQAESEEECARLVRLLPPTEAALLDWAINLMADVVQVEQLNKMNARNVAMVFAPNMTQMSDPLTALMYAVQVMNLLKTLIIRTLKEREDSMVDSNPDSRLEPSDKNGQQSSLQLLEDANEEVKNESKGEKAFVAEEPAVESPPHSAKENLTTETSSQGFLTSIENICAGNRSLLDNCPCTLVSQVNSLANELEKGGLQSTSGKSRTDQSSASSLKKGTKKAIEQSISNAAGAVQKNKGTRIAGLINARAELFEAWR
ncbi:rho GTPase-activating protein 5-like [Hibiscus syriacus]|uniref:rho GTPase-activating protein 5-like n=1 Tax=Hibiscus syriacus TaxID=106335 RepID=UPI0019229163|nr:rho GTPase-activating protein 5-like [Hibiscus syriacus]